MQSTIKSIMLFVAELNGFKAGTVQDKIDHGVNAYINNVLHHLDLHCEEDRKELHENIALERIYKALDEAYGIDNEPLQRKLAVELEQVPEDYQWAVPIEVDASASMLQYMGILLGDYRLCSMTNVIVDESGLSDPWHLEGIPRNQVKKAATPMLYGSSKACYDLWQNADIPYTMEQVAAFNTALNKGALGVANDFKNFIIHYCKPKPTMKVNINEEKFTIECNRFHNVGEVIKIYDIYDSPTDTIRTIAHTTTRKVPDLEQFRRYFVTCLVHNLDSQVANSVALKTYEKYQWVIPIHDAFIVPPQAVEDVRTWYAEALTDIYNNRKSILTNFFKSIGIGGEAQHEWEQLMRKVQPIPEGFKCNPMALK